MIDENFEFALSQYANGTLPDAERDAVEQRLAHDAEARQTVAEYRRLSTLLAASARPLPSVDWAQLTHQISRAIDQTHSVPGTAAIAAAQTPGDTYSIAWGRRPLVWAIAASLVLVSGLVWMSHQESNRQPPVLAVAPPPAAVVEPIRIAEIRVLQSETFSAPVVNSVSIGPSPAIQQASLWQLYPDVAERPASISIAGGPRQIQRDEFYAFQ